MIQIDAAFAAIFVTVLISLIAMGVAWGSLSQKVKNNCKDIGKQDNDHKEVITQIRAEFKTYQLNNREDHTMIFTKLDKILQNNSGKGNG